MLSWLKPTCPVDLREKVWTEQRLGWLVEQFGLRRMVDAEVILPTSAYFPEPYTGTPDDVRVVLDRVCGYMQVDATRIDLEFYRAEDRPDAVGLYEPGRRPTIHVSDSPLDDKEQLIATLAHEVAHDLLLGDGLLTGEEEDHEHVTDLLMAFLGIGLFAANSAVKQQASNSVGWEYWSISKQGYLPARIFGYTFALISWLRGERKQPPWTAFLGADAQCAHRDGLKFLLKTGDSLLDPDGAVRGDGRRSPSQLITDLQASSASRRLAAVWVFDQCGDPSKDAVGALRACLRDGEPILRCEASRMLPTIAEPEQAIINELLEGLRDRSGQVRAHFATALGVLQTPLDAVSPDGVTVQEEFQLLLEDQDPSVVNAAAGALGHYQSAAAELAPLLVPTLSKALIHCKYETIDILIGVLAAIRPDVQEFLSEHLAADPELHQLAADSLSRISHSEVP